MVAENRRYHVALVDPLPAGLEAMNPALAVTGADPARIPNEQKSRRRVLVVVRHLVRAPEHARRAGRGVRRRCCGRACTTYDYVARATTPGNFVVPPTKAEEMYMPETFGRSACDRVIVE